MSRTEPLWRPSDTAIRASNLTRFAEQVGFAPPDYGRLHRWSIDHRDDFWDAVWRELGTVGERGDGPALTNGDRFPGSRWFPDARLNFAENLLRFADDAVAIVAVLEDGQRRMLTYGELRAETAAFATSLKRLGVEPGDRVAGWLPNVPEAVIAMLATASIGATWSSCSPDFGVEGALDRFGQIAPKVLIACDGYRYAGKRFDVRDRALTVRDAVDSIEQVLWAATLGIEEDAFARARREHGDAPLVFNRLPFDHPLYVMYSSGTTGKPKCIVHGAGGTLLQHLKEHQLHVDLTREDTLFFFTTCGWMMWNWLVSGLASGCRIVLYDGSPFHPNPHRLFDLAEREAISVFGVSAKYLSAVEKADVRPAVSHGLPALRAILSTGSPLNHEGFRYVYRDVKADLALASISGGTDLISCFALGCPWWPVHEGELQCAGLGMAVDVYDDDGAPVRGEKGELVCTRSFPSAPIGFWDDPGDAKYRDAYFDRYPNVWAHGDFAEITAHDGFIVHGRSDAVLNPGGVRIGTAEIYRQVETIDEVMDCVAIGQDWDGDTRIVLFVVMREGTSLDADLTNAIKRRIRERASPRHVPAVIVEVPDIPRTLSGKIAELAVRDAVHGREVANTMAMANPEALAAFRERPELGG
ncbi:MAG: acetoacetate--CoA ligase [Gammaproteobacteria bacterium]|nr:acetoacetate--CoA ligase [Gammaproteobacteria bacterium]